MTPERGLTTAILAGFLISALGGSRVQIGGPTGAFVVIVYGIVERFGVDGLIYCTLLAGLILVLMGVFRLGTAIKFIPFPLTVGFTAGIAVIIFSSQIKDFLGLQIGTVPADFIEKWNLYLKTFSTLNWTTLLLSLGSLFIILFWPRLSRKIPGSIIAIVVITTISQIFHLPVETIGSRFGDLPQGLPHPHLPALHFSELRQYISPAFTVALLGAIESLLSATVADGMIEGKHRSNTELIAQGIANMVTPIFGGIPATGAIARTATNVKNGGRTPVAGLVHALTLFCIVLLFGKWAKLIPLCVLASILIVVSYHMSEWRAFRSLLKAPRMDIAVLLTSFALTVFADLTVAVEVGMLLSVILFMKRMTDVTRIREVTQELDHEECTEKTLQASPGSMSKRKIPKGVMVFEAEGAFFFGSANILRDTLNLGMKAPQVLILRMRHVLVLDATGIRVLEDLRHSCVKSGTTLILSGIHAQPLFALQQSDLFANYGEKNIVENIDQALDRAKEIIGTL